MGWLYLIADFSCGENIIETVLAAGVDYIQLRGIFAAGQAIAADDSELQYKINNQ